MQKWAVLGASRGLGKSFALEAARSNCVSNLLLVSRKAELLRDVARECGPLAQIRTFDFTRKEHQSELLRALESYAPTHLAYIAGGGPYGAYGKKAYSAHRWAFELCFLFPSHVIHHAMTELHQKGLVQMIVVGSSIAENKPDPNAASYSASKHALSGLIKSIHAEGCPIDLRLLSPGYIDTGLLPPGADARQQAVPLLKPEDVAKQMWQWSQNQSNSFHLEV
jgi:short-subunit dehydrogenase